MATAKIAISLNEGIVKKPDRLVKSRIFLNEKGVELYTAPPTIERAQ